MRSHLFSLIADVIVTAPPRFSRRPTLAFPKVVCNAADRLTCHLATAGTSSAAVPSAGFLTVVCPAKRMDRVDLISLFLGCAKARDSMHLNVLFYLY